jgi:predicted membrane channel-forming protein YqfA (hemolysin III family)
MKTINRKLHSFIILLGSFILAKSLTYGVFNSSMSDQTSTELASIIFLAFLIACVVMSFILNIPFKPSNKYARILTKAEYEEKLDAGKVN